MNKTLITAGIVVLLIIAVMFALGQFIKNEDRTSVANDSTNRALAATVYKSPSCGCCVGYSSSLEDDGFNVEIVSIENMKSIKERYNIPTEMESCHTAVIEGYFIEGHVPIEVVNKLLSEKPEIDGIALPDMPAGTPGMPGLNSRPYTIYQLIDGEYSEYITI